MLIYNESVLIEFAREHANARKNIQTWKMAVVKACWFKKQDVLADFTNAKMIADNRARFEIRHNIYRLIIKIRYEAQLVDVRFIGTHNEYDRIDPETV